MSVLTFGGYMDGVSGDIAINCNCQYISDLAVRRSPILRALHIHDGLLEIGEYAFCGSDKQKSNKGDFAIKHIFLIRKKALKF